MEKVKIDKLINAFKNNKDIIAIRSLAENVSNIYGNIDENIFFKVKDIIEKFQKTFSSDYVSFNLAGYMVIYFKYDKDGIILFGTSNLKEPIVRMSIKSLK